MLKSRHSSWYLNIFSDRRVEVEVDMTISAGCWLYKIWEWSGCAFSSKLASCTTRNQLNYVQESLHWKAIFSPWAEVLEPKLFINFFTKKCSRMKARFASYYLKEIWVPISFILTYKIKLLSGVSCINRTLAHKQALLCCQCMVTWIPGTSHYMQNKHFQKE